MESKTNIRIAYKRYLTFSISNGSNSITAKCCDVILLARIQKGAGLGDASYSFYEELKEQKNE